MTDSQPMPTAQPTSAQKQTRSTSLISPDLLLSLATAPFLIGLIGQKWVTRTLQDIGLLSEELFRGDRLPVLPIQPSRPAQQDDEPE